MNLYSRVILLLIILQAVVTGFLVVLSFATSVNQNMFALFLSVDLISFAMVTYVYRTGRTQNIPNKLWIILGSSVIATVFFSSIIFA